MLKVFHNAFRYARYSNYFNQAYDQPQVYWKKEVDDLDWYTKPKTIIDQTDLPFVKWFPDGQINITHNLLDRHLEDRKDIIAYHYQSPITNKSQDITIGQLHLRVSKFAGALQKDFGLKKGDTVIIYMPMIIESIIAQFACARLGLIHSVVFGGFAATELASRIKDCDAKLIICASAGKQPNKVINYQQIVQQASHLSGKSYIPKIIFERQIKPRKIFTSNYYDFLQVQQAGNSISPVKLQSNHPLYILYTSGTTGAPKGIVRDQGGTAVVLNHALKIIYDLKPNDGLFCSSDIGWVLGHSFITYAPLLRAIRTILFEGKPVGTPDAGTFWRLIEKHKINHLYTSPTAMRGIRKQDPQGKFIKQRPLKSLVGLTLVGQRCDVQTFKWVQKLFPNRWINDTYWQTQTGAPILTNFNGLQTYPFKPGSACKPVPGYNVKLMNKSTGKQCKPNQSGIICMKLPTPPSFMLTLWKKNQAFKQKYFSTFPGYYDTGDSGYYDEDGYHYIMSRVDDIINTAGHRLSTGQMQQVLMKNQYIAQAIVVGVKDEIKGEVPVGFVTVKKGYKIDQKQLQKEVVKLIRKDIGAVASFKQCYVVQRIPKTRSGKYLRNIVRKMYNMQQYIVPSTVQNMEVVTEIEQFIKGIVR